jgi:hypothetical protein
VKQFGRLDLACFLPDPCRRVRQVEKFDGSSLGVAVKLLHLPDKPAGVGNNFAACFLAFKLLHLPDKPAGVGGDRRQVSFVLGAALSARRPESGG